MCIFGIDEQNIKFEAHNNEKDDNKVVFINKQKVLNSCGFDQITINPDYAVNIQPD